MLSAAEQLVSRFLEELAQEIDISPSKYKQAVDRYQAVGSWLAADNSPLHTYRPEVYPQGSFRLGTVVRPVHDGLEADYDIDLVCQLHRAKVIGQERDVKHSVGDRLKANGVYREMLDKEGRRCWTLNYAEEDGVGFHMDCLPCVPDQGNVTRNQIILNVPWEYAQYAVGITHKRDDGGYKWLSSNPRGYARWFDSINRNAFLRVVSKEKKLLLERAKGIYGSIEEIPNGLVRTPLQRTIQILKRHRDWKFTGHPMEEDKPISIIITTLAAKSYEDEPDIYGTLLALFQRIENYPATQIIREVKGQWYIGNPVDPEENFADRWNEPGSNCAEAFFQWVKWMKQSMTDSVRAGSVNGIVDALDGSFDRQQLERVEERLQPTKLIVKARQESVPALADHRHLKGVLWPLDLRYKVRVKGTVHKDTRQAQVLWQLASRSLPKEMGLRFRAETNVTPPYVVKWQVVNTGTEAAAAGGLRGEFYDGEGDYGTTRWESTLYRGTHWIEAFVIKNGVCVARSGHVYVMIR
jgi:hypothetical protein